MRGWGWRHAGRRRWAVRRVDLRVEPGERVLLLGPSGAGKSTLLAGLAGLLDASTAAEQEGAALVDGAPADRQRTRVGMLFQDPETSLVMARAGDDVAFGLENRGVPAAEIWPRVDAAVRAVGFPYGHDRPTTALSGGEQQRLALAGAVAAEPALLLLDEPTANLDPQGAALVRAAVRRALDATGATLLLVEHRVADALELVDRVVVLEPGGGVVADGAPGAVFAAHGRALAAAGVWVPGAAAAPPRRAARAPGPAVLEGDGLVLAHPGRPPVVDGLDVALRAGEATAVVGPNGAGKSTLALALAGLLAPAAGAVRLPGAGARPLHRWRARDLCRRVGTVFQDPEHQFLTARVDDELLLGPRRTGVPEAAARARVDELLARLRLDGLAGANPFTLSGGEKRRLSVATALATAPDVLVLDEPTFGQDARTWAELLDLLAALRDGGTSLLAVTHDEPFAAALADRRLALARPPAPAGAAA
ncbi:ATP-binding cassette domain-containing protein [Vallicoccus soli]|uniref:ATP-binding cassette domain-containing protein n=1 Tax=Vallicoccus soli TaxID=2339232 RepID=A0A3A3Z4T2_9ACTN|nr:ATP-binding cassette domain-containing protein [Vallicoccus soli]